MLERNFFFWYPGIGTVLYWRDTEMENLLPTLPYSQSPTHSRPAEFGSRQAIQARPDHPKGSGLSFQRSSNQYAAGDTGLK